MPNEFSELGPSQTSRVRRRRRRAGIALLLSLAASAIAVVPFGAAPSVSAAAVGAEQAGGPVILDGTDLGWHGSIVLDNTGVPKASELRSTWVYQLKAWETLLAGVPASYAHNGRVAIVGALDATQTNNDCGAAAHFAAERLSSGAITVDYFNGATAIGTLFDSVLAGTSNYQMIQIVDYSCRNGLDSTEAAQVDTRGPAIAAHVNRGGALFTQSHSYGWLNSLFPNLSRDTGTDECPDSFSPKLTPAGFAHFPTLTDADITAYWHNCFVVANGEFPLKQLAMENGHTIILGGDSVKLPSTVSLTTTPEQPRPGDEVCTTATVVKAGTAVKGAIVEFFLDGVSVGTRTTDDNGQAVYCYTALQSGENDVTATVTEGTGAGTDTTTVTTSTLSLGATPSATQPRDATVCINVIAGTTDGVTETPTAGATIQFSVSGPNGPATASDVTDNSGAAQYCYTGTNGGRDTVTAEITSGAPSDSRAIVVNWTGAVVDVVNVEQVANGTGKVVPVTVAEFAPGTVYATVTIPAGSGTLNLDTSGFTVSPTSPTTSFVGQTTLAFQGDLSHVTGLLASRLKWTAPADVGTSTITVTVADDPTTPVQTATDTGTLSVSSPPVITTQPDNTTVDPGTTIVLRALSTGVPAPVAQWQVSTDTGTTWTNVSGGRDGNLSLAVDTEMNGNWYRARFSNASGNVVTDAAVLTVNPAVAPAFTDDALTNLTVGTAVSDGVHASGLPGPTYSVTAGALPAGLALNRTTGAITGTPSSTGTYTFTITATNVAGSVSIEFTGSVTGIISPPTNDVDEPDTPVKPPDGRVDQPKIPVVPLDVTAQPPTSSGAKATITGQGFKPGSTVQIIVDGEVVGTAVADAEGNVSVDITPPSASKDYRLGLRGTTADDALVEQTDRIVTNFNGKSVVVPDDTGYLPIVATRLLDTRNGERPAAGSTVRIAIDAESGVPVKSTAVAINVAAVQPDGIGFVTVHGCASDRPEASVVNFEPGANSSNMVIVELDDSDQVCVYTSHSADLVVDLSGAFGPTQTDRAGSLEPTRLVDTRGGARVNAGETVEVQVTGNGLAPTGSAAAVLNVAAPQAESLGFFTLFPCDEERPLASNVNYTSGATDSNLAFVKLSNTGTVCVYSSAATHLVIDLNGSFASSNTSQLISNVPVRFIDTRTSNKTVAGQTLRLELGTHSGLHDVDSYALNVTAAQAENPGWASVYPCGTQRPLASSLNYTPGVPTPNHTTAKPGIDGAVCIYVSATTHIVVDVEGVYL